jgi:hypothetical protein
MPNVAPGTLIRTTPYMVTSSEGFIAAGDVVINSSIAGNTALPLVKGITGAAGVYSSGIVGIAAHCMLSDQGSTAVSLNNLTSGILLVYDDPLVQYVVSDCGSSVGGGLLTSQVGQTVNVLATGGLGTTGPFQSGSLSGRSNQSISGASTAVTVLPFKLLGLHPVDNASTGGLAHPRKWIVMMNDAMLVPGLGSVTT